MHEEERNLWEQRVELCEQAKFEMRLFKRVHLHDNSQPGLAIVRLGIAGNALNRHLLYIQAELELLEKDLERQQPKEERHRLLRHISCLLCYYNKCLIRAMYETTQFCGGGL
jgi:hypothetical protein